MLREDASTPNRGRWAYRRSRAALVGVAVIVVAAGLGVARLVAGPWGDPVGDALYAVLVYVLVLLVAPRTGPVRAAAIATAVCVAVELLQLTGLPAAVVRGVPAARYVLGTTFAAVDLVVYALAATVAVLTDRAVSRRAPSRGGPSTCRSGP